MGVGGICSNKKKGKAHPFKLKRPEAKKHKKGGKPIKRKANWEKGVGCFKCKIQKKKRRGYLETTRANEPMLPGSGGACGYGNRKERETGLY